MGETNTLTRRLKGLFAIAAILLLIMGVCLIIIDEELLRGIMFIVSSAAMGFAAFRFARIQVHPLSSTRPHLLLGFIFMVVGLTIRLIPLWAVGFIFFIAGIFLPPKETDQ